MRTETHDAFADPEQRYRRRYVDLTVNDQVKKHLSREPKCSMRMRSFFNDKDILR
jgi:lysyl-tRNA synthetase class 2